MDIEKLIEDLRGLLKQYGEKIPYGELVGAPWPYSRAGDLVWQDPEPYFIEHAATALSTLQAENEKLRAELEQARAEITRLKHYEDKCHDCPIVCAKTEIIKAHEGLEAVQAELEQKSKLIAQQAAELERRDKLLKEQETELEQVKREREKLERFLGELEGAVYTGQYFHLRPMIEKWRGQKED